MHQRRALVADDKGKLQIRIILDRFSMEVFVGEGEQVMSAGLYTELGADGISFLCDGKALMSVRKWEL